ncbi:MAG TPA: preprotein translocase subunit YajC, partial [Acidobacteriaceae bacterium]|nr:preprotein translocase subunit YajC [Acidobacteriaceae bacterium]
RGFYRRRATHGTLRAPPESTGGAFGSLLFLDTPLRVRDSMSQASRLRLAVCVGLAGNRFQVSRPGRRRASSGSSVENDSVLRRRRVFNRFGQKDRALISIALPASFALPFALPTGFASLLPILLMIVVFYFLLIRPQQKRQKQWQSMLGNLKPGDRITTSGGMRGTILSIREDTIQLRVPPDNLRIEVVKSAIASVTQEETK